MQKCHVQYVHFGLEICPTSIETGQNKYHHQGWCYFENPQGSIKNVAKNLGKCHVEMCNGSEAQNTKYCSKDGIITEYGEEPEQGKRTDLAAWKDKIKAGMTVDQIADESPDVVHQYGRVFDRLEGIYNRQRVRTWQTTCEWAFGPTGTGKTYAWKSIWDPEQMWVYKLNDRGWCDGYRGQPVVIINELRPGGIPYNELLNMIDEIPHWLPNRGKEPIPFLAKHIYITSSLRPEEVYWDLPCNDMLEQLMDRIVLREFTGKSKRVRAENIFLADVIKDGKCEKASCFKEADCSQNHGLPKEYKFG